MKTVYLSSLTVLLISSASALADVDFTCRGDCIDRGYSFGYCTERCSYGGSQSGGGYRPEFGLGALQQGERAADEQTRRQLELIRQVLEIKRMQQELERQRQQSQ